MSLAHGPSPASEIKRPHRMNSNGAPAVRRPAGARVTLRRSPYPPDGRFKVIVSQEILDHHRSLAIPSSAGDGSCDKLQNTLPRSDLLFPPAIVLADESSRH